MFWKLCRATCGAQSRLFSSLPAPEMDLFRVPDLRYLLRFAGLPASGSRIALEERLQQHGDKELSPDGRKKVAHNFGHDLKAALSKLPPSQRPDLLAEALRQLGGESHLEELVKAVVAEKAAAATCVAEASALACVVARLRKQVHTSQPVRAPSPSVVRSLGFHYASSQMNEQAGMQGKMQTISPPTPVQEESHDVDEVSTRRRAAILGLDLRQYGVGGLSAHAQQQLQQALLSRALSDSLRERLGMKHQSGMLLFGPPGCGKTLIARGLAKALQATTVQYVTAADINAKWFGESDQHMRSLFDPGRESKEQGRTYDLHLIVMDEIDALAASRSGSDARNHESALTVLLACMDGFEDNSQTVVLGLTNRRDKLDPALLRPGRLGVQVEVGQPDVDGRLDVLKIHTKELALNGYLAQDVSLPDIARRTVGFSGACLRQLVDSATAIALLRMSDEEWKTGLVATGLLGQSEMEAALSEALKGRAADKTV